MEVVILVLILLKTISDFDQILDLSVERRSSGEGLENGPPQPPILAFEANTQPQAGGFILVTLLGGFPHPSQCKVIQLERFRVLFW